MTTTPAFRSSPHSCTLKAAMGTAVMVSILGACASAPPAPPPERTFNLTVPKLTPLPETKELQQQGGITIGLAPAPIHVTAAAHCEYDASDKFVLLTPDGVSKETHTLFEETRYPIRRVVGGDRLEFVVTINNQMPRVFRGAGAVVQLNVDGQMLGTQHESYEELLTAMIPPRSERQLTITGPARGTLPDNSIIGVFLYDIVTGTDEAGNVTEKQNFEWLFEFTRETRSETVAGTREEKWLANPQAAAAKAMQQQGIYECHTGV